VLARGPRPAHLGRGAGRAPGGAGLQGPGRRLALADGLVRHRRMRRSRLPMLLALAALSLGGLGLAACHKPAPAAAAGHPARAVTVATVQLRAIVGALAASGDLAPRLEAAVLPEVTGYRVAEVLTDVGQFVRRGQVLARLDP